MISLASAPIHLGIPTTKFAEAKKFYTDILGLKVVKEITGVAILEGGDGTKLELYQRAEPANAPHTLGGFTVQDIEATVKGLKDKGVKFEDYEGTVNSIAVTSPNSRCAWFRDKDGNYLVVSEWRD